MSATCSRCGVSVPDEWAFHEEAGETECPRCWHRCEEKELRDEIARLRAEIRALDALLADNDYYLRELLKSRGALSGKVE